MSIELRIKESRSRAFQCDVAGCRNKTVFLITKRSDVCAHPLHLCPSCIDGLYRLLHAADTDKANTAPIESAVPFPNPTKADDALSGGATSSPSDGAGASNKAAKDGEPKPNKANKKGGKR
jgi:hypothetical protein